MIIKCVECLGTAVTPVSPMRSRWRMAADGLQRRVVIQHFKCDDCGTRFMLELRASADDRLPKGDSDMDGNHV